MFYQRPKIFAGVSSRLRFKEFLNYFFNTCLPLEDERCDGGNKEFMVSSGGDIFPCSLYAYGDNLNGIEINKRKANLIHDDIEIITELIEENYLPFNELIREKATKFSTCQKCSYIKICSPCPLTDSFGKVRECEWVQEQSGLIEEMILNSSVELLILPIKQDAGIKFFVPTQSMPLQMIFPWKNLFGYSARIKQAERF